MLHQLTDWEDNGYHDSYFYVSVWDDEAKTVRAIMTGATAFAGYADGKGPDIGKPITDRAVLEDAIKWLADYIFKAIRAAEYRDVLEPNSAEKGTIIRLLRNVRHKGNVIKAGTDGQVFWSGAFGQFFDKGYNRPCRENIRLGLNFKDGSSAYVALKACQLNREPLDDEDLLAQAWDLAQGCEFSKATGEKHAWDSANFAKALYNKTAAIAA